MKLKTHPIAWLVRPQDGTLYDERAFEVRLEDEGAGAFIEVKSYADDAKAGEIKIDADCWPALWAAIETALKVVAEIDKDTGEKS